MALLGCCISFKEVQGTTPSAQCLQSKPTTAGALASHGRNLGDTVQLPARAVSHSRAAFLKHFPQSTRSKESGFWKNIQVPEIHPEYIKGETLKRGVHGWWIFYWGGERMKAKRECPLQQCSGPTPSSALMNFF